MRPVRVEVITYTPTFFFHCQHCELTFREMGVGAAVYRDQARDALPDLREEFQALSLWAHDVVGVRLARISVSACVRRSVTSRIQGLRDSGPSRLREPPYAARASSHSVSA